MSEPESSSGFLLRGFAVLVFLLQFFPLAGKRYRLSRWGIPSANYSGIASLGGNRYVVVSDEGSMSGFYIWEIEVDSLSGHIVEVKNNGFRGGDWPYQRDAEDVAFCVQRGSLFVSGEADQRILEYAFDGNPTGEELKTPKDFSIKEIQPNRGFEALAYDSLNEVFWTCTESPTLDALKRNPHTLDLTIVGFSADLHPKCTYPYRLDAPQAREKGGDYYHGVVAMTPLSDGSLLVLEREARISKRGNGSRCWVKLFRYIPETGKKQLVEQWHTRFHLLNTRFANYEGMCLGPVLSDGTQTLLLLSDAQAGKGKALWHLKDYLNIVRLPRFSSR